MRRTLSALAVLLGCGATTAAGVVLTWLRLRSGSLLAPAMLHRATNSLGVLAAAAAVRLPRVVRARQRRRHLRAGGVGPGGRAVLGGARAGTAERVTTTLFHAASTSTSATANGTYAADGRATMHG